MNNRLCSATNNIIKIDNIGRPRKVFTVLTMKCNSLCNHCYIRSGPDYDQSDVLPFNKLINQLVENVIPVSQMLLSGGEVFLLKDVDKLIAIAAQLYPTKILTNGSISCEDILQLIIKNKVELQVTLTGHNSAVDNLIRGQIFDRTINTIERFIELGGSELLTISIALGKCNIKHIEDIILFCIGLKVKKLVFSFILKQGRALDNWEQFALSDYEKIRVIKTLAFYQNKFISKVKISTSGLKQYVNSILDHQEDFSCSQVSEEIIVYPDGHISLCPKLLVYLDCIQYNLCIEDIRVVTYVPLCYSEKCAKCESQSRCAMTCLLN